MSWQPVDPHHPAPRQGAGIDVSALPSYAFSHRNLMWWGTLGMIAIEGTVFALTIASYFYLRMHADAWPPRSAPPALLWGSLNVAVMLVSLWPNQMLKKAAEQGRDLGRIRLYFVPCVALALVSLVLRAFEFTALNVRWDLDAYGSIVWLLLGLHTVHLLTDFYDTALLGVLMFTGPLQGQRLVDVSENCQYWYFVVASWLPIYAVLYWAPRA